MLTKTFVWLRKFPSAKPQTKFLILNLVFYFILMVVTTIWSYARIDYVHSLRQQSQEQNVNTP